MMTSGRTSGTNAARLLLAALTAAVGLGATGNAVYAQDGAKARKVPPAKKIIEASIKRSGGRDAYAKLHNRAMKGTIEVVAPDKNRSGPIERFAAAPNLHYFRVRLKDFGIYEGGSDGDIHWRMHNQATTTVSQGEEREADIRGATFNGFLEWETLYDKVECVGIEEVDGRECFKVERTPASGQADFVYYEKKTGLPIMAETVRDGENGKILTQRTSEDFREVNGVMVSFRQVRRVNGEVAVTWTWDTIEFNVDIPADKFEPPASAKEAARDAKGASASEKSDESNKK